MHSWLINYTSCEGNDCHHEFEVEDDTNENEGLRMRSKIKREGLGLGRGASISLLEIRRKACSNSVFILCLESINFVFHLMHFLFCNFENIVN